MRGSDPNQGKTGIFSNTTNQQLEFLQDDRDLDNIDELGILLDTCEK